MEDFLWYLEGERRLASNTQASYRNDLLDWFRVLGESSSGPPKPPEASALRGALEIFRKRQLSEATLMRRVSAMRLYCRYRALAQDEWSALLDELPVGRAGEALPKALTVEEILKLMEVPGAEAKDLRNRALLEIIYSAGLRVSEALALKWPDLDERALLLTVSGKGGKERIVPLTERAYGHLEKFKAIWREWCAELPKKNSSAIFLAGPSRGTLSRMGVWKILQRRSLEAGLDPVHPHMLRHSFATHLIQGGADVRAVQMLLGHSALGSTERYLKIADKELAELFAKSHPLG